MKNIKLFYATIFVLLISLHSFAQNSFASSEFKVIQDYMGNEQLIITTQLDLENSTEKIILLVSENQKDWTTLTVLNPEELQEPNALENIPFTFGLDILSEKLEIWVKVVDQNNTELTPEVHVIPSEIQTSEKESKLGIAFSPIN